MERGNNVLVCVEFIGKTALSSDTKFKVKVDAVEVMRDKKK